MTTGTSQQTGTYSIRFVVTACLLCCLCGCRLFVAAGKMVLGTPVNPSAFRAETGVDLSDSDDRVVIICTAPHSILQEFPSLQLDLLDRIARNLKRHEIKVVSSDDVASWYDDRGEWGDYTELAEHFDARYVLRVNLRRFTYVEPSGRQLLRGRTEGSVTVYEVGHESFSPVNTVFEEQVRVVFPDSYPIPRGSNSVDTFVSRLLDRLSERVSQLFYDHGLADTIH